MPNGTPRRRAGGPEAEKVAMDRLMERLMQIFPEVPEDVITRAVEGRYHDFDHSRVRDFVPVLVERTVRQQLQTSAPHHRA